jgi:hypothetical protein
MKKKATEHREFHSHTLPEPDANLHTHPTSIDSGGSKGMGALDLNYEKTGKMPGYLPGRVIIVGAVKSHDIILIYKLARSLSGIVQSREAILASPR